MKGKGRTQGTGFAYVMAVPMAGLLIMVAMIIYDYRNDPFKGARTDTYFAEQSGPFCLMEGVWHNWEDDETIALGCLEVKRNIREGGYSSAKGPRATSDFSISGTYDLDSDDSIQVTGKDRQGRGFKFTEQSMSMTRSIPRR